MLSDKNVVAVLAVKDMAAGKKFYSETLGFTSVSGDDEGGIRYKSGSTEFFVYQSSFAGSNQATAAAWVVGDSLDQIIKTLQDKGVKFEHYEMPGVKVEGDVHVMGKLRAAWFKDPDGNILNVVNGM